MNDQRFKYYAFISYSHTDQKWAEWLHRKLEGYRLPSTVRKESNGRLPKQIRPVFRDKTDIGIGSLQQSLRNELEDSRFLVVICSPNSAKSVWVSREIEHFRALGRGDRIIPFIVEGEPNAANPEQECYPQALRDSGDSILGASVPELQRDQALVKVVAAILGLKFDQLWQRHKRRERQKKIFSGLVSLAVLTFILGGLGIAWDYNREKTAYFADYVEQWGVPVGLGKLNAEEVRHRAYSWRIVSQYWKVQSLLLANSAGKPTPPSNTEEKDRPISMRFFYRETGKLAKAEEYDAKGMLLRVWAYNEDFNHVWFKQTKNEGLNFSLSSKTQVLSIDDISESSGGAKSGIIGWNLVFDSKGRIETKLYLNSNEEPACDAEGIAGLKYEYDKLGGVKQIVFLGINGKQISIRSGVSCKLYRYDAMGRRLSTSWLDKNGNSVLNPDGVAHADCRYDTWGNALEYAYYDTNRILCLHKGGVARQTIRYDERGNRTEEAFWDVNGNLCFAKDGYARGIAKYDQQGNPTEVELYGVDGNPCLGKDGVARQTIKYDKCGHVSEIASFGVDGKLCLNSGGFARSIVNFDEDGHITDATYFGTDGNLCLCKGGYARFIAKHDQRGNRIEETYFGADGNLCLCKGGYARFIAKHDQRGNRIEETYFGADGNMCIANDGFARITSEFDERGNLTAVASFDCNGNPQINKMGSFSIKMQYDENGNLIRASYIGNDGKLCSCKDGYAVLNAVYDKGNRIEETYFGPDGKPCPSKHGAFKGVAKYDKRGNRIEEAYFGLDGNLCVNKDGYAQSTAKYDEKGIKVEEAYFGADGNLCVNNNGFSRCVMRYDKSEGWVTEEFFDQDGNLCSHKYGYARIKTYLDYQNNPISCAFFGSDGKHVDTFVVVGEVISKSQAEKIGLMVGDIIATYSGIEVTDILQLSHLTDITKGNEIQLEIVRGGRILEFIVNEGKLGAMLHPVAKGKFSELSHLFSK